MPKRRSDDPQQRTIELNESAQELISRGRLRLALDRLNRAILLDPSYPDSFVNRAEVFERMGMFPQADADRRRAQALYEKMGDPEAAARAARTVAGAPTPARFAPPGHQKAGGFSVPPGLLMALVATAFLAAFAGGVILAVNSIDFDGSSPRLVATSAPQEETPTPLFTAQPPATTGPEGTPPPSPLVSGSPFSLSSLQRTFQAGGATADVTDTGAGFSGFAVAAVGLRVSAGGESAAFAVLVYPNREAPANDWELVPGERPTPKSGRALPAHLSIWWNANVVVVLLSDTGGLSNQLLERFLEMTP
jgi:hypothetical protein